MAWRNNTATTSMRDHGPDARAQVQGKLREERESENEVGSGMRREVQATAGAKQC